MKIARVFPRKTNMTPDEEKQPIQCAQEDRVDSSWVKLGADMLRDAMEEEMW